MGWLRNTAPTDALLTNDNNILTSNAWQLLIYRWSDASDVIKLRRNGGADKSLTTSLSMFGGNALRYVSFGLWTASDGASYISNNAKIAHMAVWDAYLADADCDGLWNGGTAGAGKNPTAVATSNLKAYWYDSKTSYTGSYAITDLEGSITLDTGDNPNVDAPSGGGDTLAPNVPGGVTATGATESSFNTGCNVTTDNGGGAVSGYKVRLYDSSDTVLSTVDKGNTRTHTFSGLSAGTLYKVAWSAYDDATPSNNSAYSSPVSITTNAMMAFASSTPAVSAIASAGTMTMTGTSRQFQITLYQEDGATPLAGRTGLWYAWWPSIAAAQTQAATIYGTGASTNGSGQITFAAPSALTIGNNQGYGVISDQDATPDSAEIAYVGSFDVI
jgi:hypothetical protein